MDWELLLWIGVGLVALDVAYHILAVLLIVPMFETPPPFRVSPSTPDSRAELVEISTSDGLTLRGSLRLPRDPDPLGIIVFCPELHGNHWMAMRYGQGLLDAGFAVLSFDFRCQGESDHMPAYEPLHWLTDYEVRDVLSVVNYTRERNDLAALPVGLMGVSRGGGAALAAAAVLPEVRCVVTDSAYSTASMMLLYTLRWSELYIPRWIARHLPEWHVHVSLIMARRCCEFRRRCSFTELERQLPRLADRDVLLISGGRDSYVAPENSERLRRHIGENCRIWCVPEAKHNSARQAVPNEYDKRVTDVFLNMVPVHRLAEIEPVHKSKPVVEQPVRQFAE